MIFKSLNLTKIIQHFQTEYFTKVVLYILEIVTSYIHYKQTVFINSLYQRFLKCAF